MRIWIAILLIIVAVLNGGCLNNFGSHAIQCLNIGEQEICFVREVWGFNGEKVSLTTSNNVCHRPSIEEDYTSNSLRSCDTVFYKVEDEKLYIHSKSMNAPINKFLVEVVFEPYNPLKPSGKDLLEMGYQEINLGKDKMIWCFDDIF